MRALQDNVAMELYSSGKRAWPDVELSEERFRAHLEKLGGEPSPDFAADLYLACACAEGSERAIDAFEKKYLPEIDRGFAKVTASDDERADARQQLLERLFVKKKIADYAGTG